MSSFSRAIFFLGALTISAAAQAQPAAFDLSVRQAVDAYVDAQAGPIAEDALKIWGFAEPGFRETRSSALLQTRLGKAGFTVKNGVAGMPTAFVASYRTGPGHVIAILAEFDALPGISQDATATAPKPVEGAVAGHACGHNLLGSAAVGGAIAVSKWLHQSGFKGEIRVYGAPAEEGGDGKAYMVRAGLFSDVDTVLHWHPADRTAVSASTSQANIKTDFTFHGLSSHAAAAPERGRSAMAGLEVMDVAINYMRQFTPDGTRIHGIVTEGGKAPNVVPAIAKSSYYVRHVDVKVLKDLQARVLKAAQGAAMATETTVDWQVQGGVYPMLINDTLLDTVHDNLEQAAAKLSWSAGEQAYGQALQKSMNVKVDMTGANRTQPVTRMAMTGGSTDVGDISYVVPTVGFAVATWPQGTPPHSWASAGGSGSTMGVKGAVVAAHVLAASAVQLMLSPDLIARAKAELKQKQGPDFQYQSLFGDRAPPLDYTDKLVGAR